MVTKTVNRGFGPQQLTAYAAGWYYDTRTGLWVYYDTATGNFYTPQGLVYTPMAFEDAPKVVNVAIGDTLRIQTSFKYTGPAVVGATGYYVIGQYLTQMYEMVIKETTFDIAANLTTTPANRTNYADIVIPSNMSAAWNDIYVKIYGGTPSIASEGLTPYSHGYYNALSLVGADPTVSNFKIIDFFVP